ncbi:MAG: hypothetical protein VXW15_09435, partial [Bdellovibrionota bacterium]|nr:hypothetical protein [Bdellovibrionota bacterium]
NHWLYFFSQSSFHLFLLSHIAAWDKLKFMTNAKKKKKGLSLSLMVNSFEFKPVIRDLFRIFFIQVKEIYYLF